jgi:putative intracellular protease/amidase
MTKVLFAISEWGYWGEELIGPLDACDKAGYEVEFVTPTGARPTPLGVSMDPSYTDPPQGKSVTSPEMAARTRALADSDRLDKPHDLAGWVPARPYPSSPTYLRDCEEYYRTVERVVEQDLRAYDAMVIVGGSGAMVDLANNQRLHELVLGLVRRDQPVAAVCYGVAALAFARDPLRKLSIIRGRHVTGHPIDYDYHDGTGFEGAKAPAGVNFGPPFYPLEFILRDAVGPDGEFIGNVGHAESVIVDHPFITARSTESSVGCGRALVDVLDHGLRRYGW